MGRCSGQVGRPAQVTAMQSALEAPQGKSGQQTGVHSATFFW